MTRFIKSTPFALAFLICLILTASAWMLTHYNNTDNVLVPYTEPAVQEAQTLRGVVETQQVAVKVQRWKPKPRLRQVVGRLQQVVTAVHQYKSL